MAELTLVKEAAIKSGAFGAVVCDHWATGSSGAEELAHFVEDAATSHNDFKFLYNLEDSIEEKINKIAKEIYGAGQVVLAEEVSTNAKRTNYRDEKYFPRCLAIDSVFERKKARV